MQLNMCAQSVTKMFIPVKQKSIVFLSFSLRSAHSITLSFSVQPVLRVYSKMNH